MTEYKVERWAEFFPAAMPLFMEHDAEIGETNANLPFDPNIDLCEKLDAAGVLQIVTARREGQLIGYCAFSTGYSLRSKTILCGTQMLYFVTKAERNGGVGIKLYNESIRHLKSRGVKNIYPHHWLRGDSPKIARFFESIGAVEIEREYSLWIGD